MSVCPSFMVRMTSWRNNKHYEILLHAFFVFFQGQESSSLWCDWSPLTKATRVVWVELFVGSLLCFEDFFLQVLYFPHTVPLHSVFTAHNTHSHVGFYRGKKTGEPGGKPSWHRREQHIKQTQLTYNPAQAGAWTRDRSSEKQADKPLCHPCHPYCFTWERIQFPKAKSFYCPAIYPQAAQAVLWVPCKTSITVSQI